jgi:hypothetical protein
MTQATIYSLQEGTLPIAPLEDRSINILSLTRAGGGAAVHFVITRDSLLPGEDLNASASRQLKEVARQTQGFKELVRKGHAIGAGPTPLPGLLLETQFKQNGQAIYQTQAMVQLPGDGLLIFVLNSMTPLDDALREQWQALLAGFVPAPHLLVSRQA